MRDLDSPESLIRNAEALGNGAVAGLAPYDPERRYRDAFGAPACSTRCATSNSESTRAWRRSCANAPSRGRNDGQHSDLIRSLLAAAGHRVVTVDATAECASAPPWAAGRLTFAIPSRIYQQWLSLFFESTAGRKDPAMPALDRTACRRWSATRSPSSGPRYIDGLEAFSDLNAIQ